MAVFQGRLRIYSLMDFKSGFESLAVVMSVLISLVITRYNEIKSSRQIVIKTSSIKFSRILSNCSEKENITNILA